MSQHEKLKSILSDWQERMTDMEAQIDALQSLTDARPESPLISAIHAVMGMTIIALNAAYPGLDAYLEPWFTEHEYGARPMAICFKGEPLREISTIDALADFYIEDCERAKA